MNEIESAGASAHSSCAAVQYSERQRRRRIGSETGLKGRLLFPNANSPTALYSHAPAC